MGSTQPQVTQERWLSKLLPLAFLPLSRPLRSLHPLRAAQGKDSGDLASSSLQLRWTLPVQPDPHWELNLLLPLTCLGGEEALKPEEVGASETERRRRPNKGKKCPTVEQIKAKMGEGMEGDWCVLSQLGWIDENGNENNATSTADLMTLKPEVLAELEESAMATCAQERVAMIGKMMEKKHKRCSKKFSEEDKAELMEMGLKIQGYNCFKEMFHSACQKSVKGQIYAFFQAQAMAVASTEAPTTSAPATTPV